MLERFRMGASRTKPNGPRPINATGCGLNGPIPPSPCSPTPRLSISQSEIGNYFPGSSLDAVVSAQGIQLFSGVDILQEVSRDPAQPLLSADQVVDLLRDRYSNLIIDAPTTVKEIALMYVIRRVPDQEEALQLIPAWCCQVVREYGPEDVDEDWLAFDARDRQMQC